jgi:hypothetical protein
MAQSAQPASVIMPVFQTARGWKKRKRNKWQASAAFECTEAFGNLHMTSPYNLLGKLWAIAIPSCKGSWKS